MINATIHWAVWAMIKLRHPILTNSSERGVTFDSHYTNTPICLGSRASTMTGMYEYTNGCNFSHGSLSKELWEEMSYPVILRNNGYFTGFIGKFGFPVNAKNYHEYSALPIDSFDRWYGWTGQGYFDTKKNKYMVKFAKEYPRDFSNCRGCMNLLMMPKSRISLFACH